MSTLGVLHIGLHWMMGGSMLFGISDANCTVAATRQTKIHLAVAAVPARGFVDGIGAAAQETLDGDWKRAFGATAADGGYQSAIEAFSAQAIAVYAAARPSTPAGDIAQRIDAARSREQIAYERVRTEQARACPGIPAGQDSQP